MTQDSRKVTQKVAGEIIAQQVKAYCKADKAERGKILDGLESSLNRNRKSLIRSLNTLIKRQPQAGYMSQITSSTPPIAIKPETRGRRRKYTKAVEAALCDIWEIYNHICAERLYPQIPTAINILRRDHDWHYSDHTTDLLLHMPLGTMKRYLVCIAKDKGLMRGISTTRSSRLLDQISIFHGNWSQKPVGYGQIDTVVHSGPRLEGTMAYTVSFIDMQTYWQVYRAQLSKTDDVTRYSISKIAQALPFNLTGIHSDTGDEFINYLLLAWCRQHHIEFTRSRPYEKNDNANIEERNRSVVRYYVGYGRYDCIEAVDALNELYSVLGLYVNYFQPIMKIKEKVRYANGSCYRKYDTARTPYERILAHPNIPETVKQRLRKQYITLNPKQLLAKIKALTIKLERVQKEQGYHF